MLSSKINKICRRLDKSLIQVIFSKKKKQQNWRKVLAQKCVNEIWRDGKALSVSCRWSVE